MVDRAEVEDHGAHRLDGAALEATQRVLEEGDVAEILGISRSTLWRKLREYRIA